MATQHHTPSILRRPEVEARTGLSRSTLYELIQQGKFPKPIPLADSGKAVGWIDDEVNDWISERIRSARSGSKCA